MAVCIYLDWIVGGPVNVICIGHSSDRMIGPLPPCQQSCYRHACVKILGIDKYKDKYKDKDKDKDKDNMYRQLFCNNHGTDMLV